MGDSFSHGGIKAIIAGGRDFNDYKLLKEKCEYYFQNYLKFDHKKYNINPYLEIVSGTARGADSLGEDWAVTNLIHVQRFPADWDLHGKAAGHIRNRQMGDYADVLIAFWDKRSKGTKGMIDYMNKLGKPVRIVKY